MANKTVSEPLIGGLPAAKWLGRQCKFRNPDRQASGNHGIAGVLHQVKGFRVVYRPANHGHDVIATVDDVLPWWSRNPDLKAEFDRSELAARQKRFDANIKMLGIKPGLLIPVAVCPIPEPEEPKVMTPMPQANPLDTEPEVKVAPAPIPDPPKPVYGAGITLTIDPDADPLVFQHLAAWQRSRKDCEEAAGMLRDAESAHARNTEVLLKGGVVIHSSVAEVLPSPTVETWKVYHADSAAFRWTDALQESSKLLYKKMVVDRLVIPFSELHKLAGFKSPGGVEVHGPRLAGVLTAADPNQTAWSILVSEADGRSLNLEAVPDDRGR